MEKKHSHHQFLTLSGSSGKPKYTTKHLAALDFLLHIPMSREVEIRTAGKLNASKMQQMEETEELLDSSDRHHNKEEEAVEEEEESVDQQQQQSNNNNLNANNLAVNPELGVASTEDYPFGMMTEFAGKKLKGPIAQSIRYPNHLRYIVSKITDQSALCRQWEDQLLNKPSSPNLQIASSSSSNNHSLLEGRLFCSRMRSYPMMVGSIIKYDAGEEKARIEKMKAEDQKGLEVYELPHRDWRGFSYKPLFKQLQEERQGDYFFEQGYLYDPNSLDDPSMLYGSHRYVLQRTAQTGPILSSMILYVNKEELRESLNEQFQERHPHLPPSLTLSKIRNIKKKILVACVKLDIELSTVALGMINFERLCLKGYVTKLNRKLSMAVSILLAYKFNENMCKNYHTTLEQLLEYFDNEWDLSKKQIFEAEFGAYVYLGFLLHVPYQHLHVMYTRLLTLINKTSRRYLGEEMQDVYLQEILLRERLKQQKEEQEQEQDEMEKEEEEEDEEEEEHEEEEEAKGEISNPSTSSHLHTDSHPETPTSSLTKTKSEKMQKFTLPNLKFFEEKKKSKDLSKEIKDQAVAKDGGKETGKDIDVLSEVEKVAIEAALISPKANLKSLTESILKIPKRLASTTPPLPDGNNNRAHDPQLAEDSSASNVNNTIIN